MKDRVVRQGIPPELSETVLEANIGVMNSNMTNLVDSAVAVMVPMDLGTNGFWAEANEATTTLLLEPSGSHVFRIEAEDHL